LGVGLIGFIAYLPQIGFPFIYDDISIIRRNPTVCGGPWLNCLTQPYWPREVGFDPLYRPVTTFSLRLTYAFVGEEPVTYRVANGLLHAACSALVALLSLRLLAAGGGRRQVGAWATWIAGLIFAVHPLHAEAVALVVGRAELLAALFSLLLIARHVAHVAGPRGVSVRHHLVMTLLFLLAVGCKEHAVLLLPAVACLDVWARPSGELRITLRQQLDRLARSHYLGLILGLAGFLFVRWLMFGWRTSLPADLVNPLANPLAGASTTMAVSTAPALLFLALRLFVVPVGLCPIWGVGGFDLPQTPWRAEVLVGALLVVIVVVTAIVGLRRRSITALLVALAGLFLILPCHFVPAANWLFAERWLYLPSAFLTLLVARLAAGLARPRLVFAAVLVVATGLFAVNWQYQKSWSSHLDLGHAVLDRHPHSYHGLLVYVHGCKKRGELLEAREQVGRLVGRFPNSSRSWYYQALLMDRLDRPRETLAAIDKYVGVDGPNLLTAELVAARDRARSRLNDEASPSP
jgi:hypothetical protein